MRTQPTAIGWMDPDVSGVAAQWDQAQLVRLARRVGYVLIWPPEHTAVSFVDQVREADVDAVLVPSAKHLDALTLDRLVHLADVEAATPRETFARYLGGLHGCPA
ncbi:hypothetical protein VMT65_23130 [Nocardia sp. CDC153]|uniref:hypothetical protein n=1 Tax=Nocardia sp. CDC153 TaxID=3112167 RepID=UPI002DBE349B|nr:hypothetical protein [Nocardia sp. CDC153]MEC3955947.1 hypothetical protein [Nocardia sp. CDC153]